MSHIVVDSYCLTKLNGSSSELHSAHDGAIICHVTHETTTKMAYSILCCMRHSNMIIVYRHMACCW